MATRREIEALLGRMPNVEEAAVVGEHSFIATVVSLAFAEQDEAQRQEAVWLYLGQHLDRDALARIEFILTNTPEEQRAISEGVA